MSPTPSTTSSATLEKCFRAAELARLGSDPGRAAIVLALRDDLATGPELANAVGLGRSALAGHLQLLRAAGLVDSVRGRDASRHGLTVRGRTLLAAIDQLVPAASGVA